MRVHLARVREERWTTVGKARKWVVAFALGQMWLCRPLQTIGTSAGPHPAFPRFFSHTGLPFPFRAGGLDGNVSPIPSRPIHPVAHPREHGRARPRTSTPAHRRPRALRTVSLAVQRPPPATRVASVTPLLTLSLSLSSLPQPTSAARRITRTFTMVRARLSRQTNRSSPVRKGG